jgi:hypothetical protein
MFSITRRRSEAALGVVAGLLAATAPASAQILDGPLKWDTPRAGNAWGPIVYVGTGGGGLTLARNLDDVEAIDLNAFGTQVGSDGVKAPKPPVSSDRPTESISFNHLTAAGTETGNPARKGSITASGGWDPTDALNSQDIALHAVATAIVGGLVPGGAIVSA